MIQEEKDSFTKIKKKNKLGFSSFKLQQDLSLKCSDLEMFYTSFLVEVSSKCLSV